MRFKKGLAVLQICKLCGKPEKLIKAHIIPKWAYNDIKKNNHFFELKVPVEAGNFKNRKMQDGYKDSNILCKKCDGDVIGAYDKYGKEFFDQDFKSQIKRGIASSGKKRAYIKIQDFDYTKLKLFLLSVLWRASTSTHCSVDLGKYENLIKNMLLNDNVTDENIFQIILLTWESPKTGHVYEKSILGFCKEKNGDAMCYCFTMAGFEVRIKVSKAKSGIHIEGLNISPNGFDIIVTDFYSSIMGKLVKK